MYTCDSILENIYYIPHSTVHSTFNIRTQYIIQHQDTVHYTTLGHSTSYDIRTQYIIQDTEQHIVLYTEHFTGHSTSYRTQYCIYHSKQYIVQDTI